MTDSSSKSEPRLQARIAGLLYLFVIVASSYAYYTISMVVVRGDAGATAANILANEFVFRAGFTANLLACIAYVGVTALLYGLLAPVSRPLSFTAAFFGLAGCAVSGAAMLNQLAPLQLLGGLDEFGAIDEPQRQALARLFLRLGGLGNSVSLVFFGVYCLLVGALVAGSRFLPRLIGLLMMLAGIAHLANSLATFLFPSIASNLSPYILAPVLLGEGSLCLWLVLFGVNLKKWREQAGVASSSSA